MKLWAFSVVATRQHIVNNVMNMSHNHTCAMLEAGSSDEATGKAHRIAAKLFPPSEGWTNHHVAVSSGDNVVCPEGAALVLK